MLCLDVPGYTGTPLLNYINNTVNKDGVLDLIKSRTMTVTIGGAERRITTFVHGPLRLFKMVKYF